MQWGESMTDTETITTTYTTTGSVRGTCGHAHRTHRAADACRMRDVRACRKVRGYSDRVVVRSTPVCVGDRVEAGYTPEDYDTGTVVSVGSGGRVHVAWSNGDSTDEDSCALGVAS